MIFELGEEQLDFQKAVRRFFEMECPSDVVRRLAAHENQDLQRALLSSFESLGLSAVYADSDGAASSLSELILFASECGRAVAPLHLAERVVSGPLLLSLGIDSALRSVVEQFAGVELVGRIAAGAATIARTPLFYQGERALTHTPSEGDVSLVSGVLRLVPALPDSQLLLCHDVEGVFLIELGANVERQEEKVLDFTQRRERMVLTGARALALSLADAAWWRALNCLIPAAEIAGACRRVVDMTGEYLKTRQQFGVAVGSFQAVQHPLADMLLKTEMIESLISFAVAALSRSDSQRELSSQAALRLALREGTAIVEKAIQLHGGIGFTWEHDLHLYLRRVRSISALSNPGAQFDTWLLESVERGL